MRRIALVLSLVALPLFAGEGLPQSVSILGRDLVLKEEKRAGGFLAEYIPDGETFETWTVMFAVRALPGDKADPRAWADGILKHVTARRQAGDMSANGLRLDGKDGSAVVDFTLTEPQAGIIEHNVMRCFRTEGQVVQHQYARRIYTKQADREAVRAFYEAIPKLRGGILEALGRADLPLPPGS